MDHSSLSQVALRLQLMQSPGVGDCPGLETNRELPDARSVVQCDGAFVQELEAALSLSANVDQMSTDEMLRAMLVQNRALLRDAIWRRRYARSSQVRSSLTSPGSVVLSSLTTSGNDTSGNSPQSRSGSSSKRDSSGEGTPSSPTKKSKPSPPKNFRCPLCPSLTNEKDFDRHVEKWIGKVHKKGPVKSGCCPGIRDPNHPLLQYFTVGSIDDRVGALVADIRSLVHPGAYDSLSPEGSGREIVVAARFAELYGNALFTP